MAVIWGLDLNEMQWGKFKGSYMFNKVYHLRRTKMIVYQIAMIFCVISESVGTAALSDYVDQQDGIEKTLGGTELNNDFVGIMSYNIFVGVSIATIFGAAFFFDLFWPERHESKAVRLAWRICSVVVCIMALADAIAMTVIVATRGVTLESGNGRVPTEEIARLNRKPELIYRKNAYAVTSVVFLWVGLCATIASTVIMYKSLAYIEKYGAKASHIRQQESKEASTGDVEKTGAAARSEPVEPGVGHLPTKPTPAHTTS